MSFSYTEGDRKVNPGFDSFTKYTTVGLKLK